MLFIMWFAEGQYLQGIILSVPLFRFTRYYIFWDCTRTSSSLIWSTLPPLRGGTHPTGPFSCERWLAPPRFCLEAVNGVEDVLASLILARSTGACVSTFLDIPRLFSKAVNHCAFLLAGRKASPPTVFFVLDRQVGRPHLKVFADRMGVDRYLVVWLAPSQVFVRPSILSALVGCLVSLLQTFCSYYLVIYRLECLFFFLLIWNN